MIKRKILLFYKNLADKEALEVLLEEVVMKGCEIFFVEDERVASDLFKKEPLDLLLLAEESSFLKEQDIPFLELKKPYRKEEMVEPCLTLLNLVGAEVSEELPM